MTGFFPYGADAYGTFGTDPIPPAEEVVSGFSLALSHEAQLVLHGMETLAAQDLAEARELLNLLERMHTGTVVQTSSRLVAVVADTLRVDTKLKLLMEIIAADEVLLAGLVEGDRIVTTAVIDALRLAGVVESSVNAMAVLSDALALQDAIRLVQEGEIVDVADIASALEVLVRALEHVVSEAVFSDEAVGSAIVTVLVPEVFDLGTDPEAVALRLAAVEDGLDFAVSFSFEGEPYYAISMNAASRAVTEYTNFEFNSLASFNGTLYGAGDAGLYRLEGEDDAGTPISAYIRTAMQRLAQGQASRVSDAYLGFRGDGSLQLKVVVKDPRDKQQKGYVYDLIQSPGGAPLPGRFKIGKGLQSVYMAFELGNVAGSDFAIDVLEIRPLVSYRRLP